MTQTKLLNEPALDRMMDENELDALVACSGRHTSYLSGVHQSPHRFSTYYQDNADSPRRMIVVWPRTDEPTLFIQGTSHDLARNQSWIQDVRPYREWIDSPYELASKRLQQASLESGRIGIERREMGVERWEEFQEELPHTEFVEVTDLLTRVRNVKTEPELKLLTKADEILDEAYRTVYEQARPGDTLRELETRIISEMTSNGAEGGFGWFHVRGTDFSRGSDNPTPIQEGDLIRADHLCYYEGYVANISRHAVVGSPSSKQEKEYQALLDIHRTTVEEKLHPGVPANEIFRFVESEARKRDMSPSSLLAGHGIGVWAGHEEPVFHPRETRELVAGMVVVMEPIVDGFWQLQDTIRISENGPVWISEKRNSDSMYVIS